MRACLASLLVAIVCRAVCGQTIAVEDYLGELERIRKVVDGENLSEARRRAGGLLERRIRYGEGFISADRTLLAPLSGTPDAGPAEGHSTRLGVLVDALRRETAGTGARAVPDATLLERLRKEEELGEIAKGGRLPDPLRRKTRFSRRLGERLAAFAEWIGKKLRELVDWLAELTPEKRAAPVSGLPATKIMVAVLVAAVAVALVFVAYYVYRRGRGERGPARAASSGPARSARDEDALSRSANEWENYAAELAAAGRAREAVRAWYHAVLVALYRAGMLHYRKGRTNWEYAYSLSPELHWRRRFIDVTRRFERNWYGRETSTREEVHACAASAGEILDAVRGHSTGSSPRPEPAQGSGGKGGS